LKVASTLLQYTPGTLGAIALSRTVAVPPPGMGCRVTNPDPVDVHVVLGQPQLTNVNPVGRVSSKLMLVGVELLAALCKVSVNVTGLPATTFGETIFPATMETHFGSAFTTFEKNTGGGSRLVLYG